MRKVLVIGQTPPPYHGQALMTQRLISAKWPDIHTFFIRLSFSKDIHNIGKAGFKKVFHMVEVILKAVYMRYRYGIKTLYYMPAGPNKTPMIRDLCMLGVLRLCYPSLIFHFRAAGLSTYVDAQKGILKKIANWVYHQPKAAIQLSALNPTDGAYFKAKKLYILPNGLEDEGESRLAHKPSPTSAEAPLHILFVGVLSESKGVHILLEAMNLLKDEHIKMHMVGAFTSPDFEKKAKAYCKENQLEYIVQWEGVLHGEPKWEQYLQADILCFPSFYESESFGNVVVEAMMFQLPVVATRWRGIPDILVDGTTGWLVPPHDVQATADKLRLLIQDSSLRKQMGEAGRQRYLEKYRLETFLQNMHHILLTESQP